MVKEIEEKAMEKKLNLSIILWNKQLSLKLSRVMSTWDLKIYLMIKKRRVKSFKYILIIGQTKMQL